MHHRNIIRENSNVIVVNPQKTISEALNAINKTLKFIPGVLLLIRIIAISINEFKDMNMAQKAYRAMKKAAPFHPFTEQERKKLNK